MTTFLTLPEVCERLGLTKSTIYRRMNPAAYGYDPAFPRPFKERGQCFWVEERVNLWRDLRRVQRVIRKHEGADEG